MHNSLLYQTLALFTPEEWRDAGLFLQNPLFNHGHHARQNLALFTLLQEQFANPETAIPDQERLYAAFSPGSTKRYFENRMSELYGLIRKFITQQRVEKQWGATFEYLAMAQFYRERNAGDRAKQALSRASVKMSKVPGAESRLLTFWLEQERCKQACVENRRKGDLNVPPTLHALTLFYGQQVLELSALMLQQQRVVPDLPSEWSPFIEQFMALLRNQAHFGDPELQILDAAMALQEQVPEHPKDLLLRFDARFKALEPRLSPVLSKILSAYIRNFCTRFSQAFEPKFRFDVYREHLAKGWLYEQGQMTPSSFFNIVTLSLSAQEPAWLEEFLNEHAGKISGSDGHHALLYGFARYYAHLRDWPRLDGLMREIRKMPKMADAGLDKMLRILEIKTGFERHPQGETLESLLTNFSMQLQRSEQTLHKRHRELDLHFVSELRQLVRIHADIQLKTPTRKRLNRCLTRVRNPEYPVAERQWLLEKLAELDKVART